MSHYFDNKFVKDQEFSFSESVFGFNFKFYSNSGVFSKNHVDSYTKLLVEKICENERVESILDVGCGYGVIGIVLSKIMNANVDMIDINVRAVELARKNCDVNDVSCNVFESNLFDKVTSKYDLIVTNPPIRAGKKVCYEIYSNAVNYLNANGSLYLVISKQHGAKSTIEYLSTIYLDVVVVYKKHGIFILKATI